MKRVRLSIVQDDGPVEVRRQVAAIDAAMERPFRLRAIDDFPLHYDMQVVPIGRAMVARLLSTPIEVELGCSRASSDSLVLEIPLGERGFAAEQQGVRHAVGPGEALVSMGRLPRRNTAAEGVELLILQLPSLAFEPWVSPTPGRHGARAMGVLARDTPGLAVLAAYLRAVVDGPDPVDDRLEALMSTQLHDLSLALVCAAWPDRRRSTAHRRAHEARRYVLERLSSPELDEASVARGLGVAGSTVRRWFAADGGLACFVRAQRLQRARAMLSDPGCARLRVIDIATACGFHEVSTFNRLCRREWGLSPTALRRAPSLA